MTKATQSGISSGKIRNLTLSGVLMGIIILMAFTPVGYLKTGGLEITFILIPVVIGATTLGPGAGALLGGVFGITSFIQCFGLSPFGAILFGINPIFCFITCVIPRVLTGFLSGLIFKGLKKVDKTNFISYGVASLSAAILNTVLFMGTLLLCFWNTDFIQGMASDIGASNVFIFVILFVGINGLIEAGVTFVLGTAISKPLAVAMKKFAKA